MKVINTVAALLLAGSLAVPALSLAANQGPQAQAKPPVSMQQSVNINTADERSLENVVGLGPAKAKAIVSYRNQNGKFTSVEDLTQVPGIGDKLLARVKGHLTV